MLTARLGFQTRLALALRALGDGAARQAGPEPTPADLLLNGLIALADDYAAAGLLCRAAVGRMASGWTQCSPFRRESSRP